MTTVETPRLIAATVTANGALVAGKHTPVDATAGPITVTLPTVVTPGAHLSVEKSDASSNTVTVSGTIRGTATTTALTLKNSSVTFVAENSGTSWTPTAGRIPETTFAGLYATQAQVAGARRRPGTSIIWMGDSLTAYNGGTSIATPTQSLGGYYDAKGIQAWANVILHHDLHVIGNAGIGGQSSSQIAARFATDVVAYNPAIVAILAGTNDGTTAPATTWANLKQMYDAALAAGILVLAMPIPPSSASSSTSTVQANRMAVNENIRHYARTTPGIILADFAAIWQDTTQTGYVAQSVYIPNDPHPGLVGAMAAGQVVATALRPYVPRNRKAATTALAPYNLLSDPHFTGAVSGSAGTFTVGGWSVHSATATTVTTRPRTDGLAGNEVVLTVPTDGWANITTNVNVDGTALSVGDEVDFGIEFAVSAQQAAGVEAQQITAYLQQYNGSGFSNRSYDVYSDSSTQYGNGPYPAADGAFAAPPVAVVAGIALVQAVVAINGGGTYVLRGASMRNVTTIGY